MNYLFRKFPELEKRIPYIDLGLRDPELYKLHTHPEANVISTAHISDLYGGNKSNRLAYLLGDAISKEKNHIVTFGGTGSNHSLATAAYCHKLGLKCTLILHDQEMNSLVAKNYKAFKQYGAMIIDIHSTLIAGIAFKTYYRWRFPDAYFIEVGGSNNIGMLGAMDAALAMISVLEGSKTTFPDVIFFPTASNGGVAALMVALYICGWRTEVFAIRVASDRIGPFELNTDGTIARAIKKFCHHLNVIGIPIDAEEVNRPNLIHDYAGVSYGRPTMAGDAATSFFATHTGLQLDSVYSAKTAAAFLDYIRSHPDQKVTFYHSYSNTPLLA